MESGVKNILLSPYFIGGWILYCSVRICRSYDVVLPGWINGYLTDLLCMPLVFMICLVGVRFIKRNPQIEISKWLILVLFVEYAVVFEWILPARSDIYTADLLDVFMYAIGCILFYFLQPQFKVHSRAQKIILNSDEVEKHSFVGNNNSAST